jgi:hypothetical protein
MRAYRPKHNTPNGVFPATLLRGASRRRSETVVGQIRAMYDLAIENIEHEGGESTSAPHSKFFVDVVEMFLHGGRRHVECLTNGHVRLPLDHQGDNFSFARRQTQSVVAAEPSPGHTTGVQETPTTVWLDRR